MHYNFYNIDLNFYNIILWSYGSKHNLMKVDYRRNIDPRVICNTFPIKEPIPTIDISHGVDESLQMMRDMWKRDVNDMLMSPLAVNTGDMLVMTMPPLEFRYFDVLPEKIKLQNNGLTVTMNGLWDADRQPCIAGANLDDKYNFSHLHFHWTDVDDGDVVNEHIVNGRGHKLEMHLIFFKGSCQTVFEAESINNGLVTLVYLFNVTENRHFGIYHITTHLSNVRTFGQTARIPVFPLSYLVHNEPCEYFTYLGKIDKRGSKCVVTQWIVFTKTFDVNREQVDQFRCMQNKHGHAINRNYRKANLVPPDNNIRPYLVVLDVNDSNSTHGDVVVAEDVAATETEAQTPSSGLRQISRSRSMAVIASEKDGNSSWTLCVKSTKTQLLRRMYNLNKLSVNKHWPPIAKTIAISNRELEQKTDAESEKHLRSKLSFNYVTRPSWK